MPSILTTRFFIPKYLLSRLINQIYKIIILYAPGNPSNSAKSMTHQFPQFGSVQAEPTDHYFISSNDSDAAKKRLNHRDTLSTIMKEWKILENNLPDSIFVRVYETRIDLLRAAIVGPAGTPYHDGIFFFDILLPFDYPKKPPQVHYHSYGHRINPNLYANGTVCLSLINTWQGATSEMWTKKSTILQILVSIQGLVLNERPYFNEPGYFDARNSKDSVWINRSNQYSENAFVLSCKTMLHLIRKPPENFEGLVGQHFRDRAELILAAIKDYQEGCVMVGQFDRMNSKNITEGESSLALFNVSPKFKADLTSLHSDLKKAFSDVISDEPIVNRMNISTDQNVMKELPSSSNSTDSKGLTEDVIKKELPTNNISANSMGSTEDTKKVLPNSISTDSKGLTDNIMEKELPTSNIISTNSKGLTEDVKKVLASSITTDSKINGKKDQKPNKKGVWGKLMSKFGKCVVG